MAVPVWLLDVDGVLNADRPGWGAAPHRGYAYANSTEWPIRWAPALIGRIRALHVAQLVELRWCTTWCPEADQLERLFRLPRLPRALDDNPMPRGEAAWELKLAAARAVLAGGRRLIWTDDELPAAGPLHEELAAAGDALLITPSPRRGLQPEHLDAIDAFASAG